jgi:predicted small lipoprotein YifL
MQLNSSVATRSAARGLILGAIWVSAAGAISGCGQKGALTLPGAVTPAASAASTPAAASAPAR